MKLWWCGVMVGGLMLSGMEKSFAMEGAVDVTEASELTPLQRAALTHYKEILVPDHLLRRSTRVLPQKLELLKERIGALLHLCDVIQFKKIIEDDTLCHAYGVKYALVNSFYERLMLWSSAYRMHKKVLDDYTTMRDNFQLTSDQVKQGIKEVVEFLDFVLTLKIKSDDYDDKTPVFIKIAQGIRSLAPMLLLSVVVATTTSFAYDFVYDLVFG